MTVTTFDRIAIKNALHAGADSFNVYCAGECDQGYLENRVENLRDSVAGLTVAEAREWLEAAYEQQCETSAWAKRLVPRNTSLTGMKWFPN